MAANKVASAASSVAVAPRRAAVTPAVGSAALGRVGGRHDAGRRGRSRSVGIGSSAGIRMRRLLRDFAEARLRCSAIRWRTTEISSAAAPAATSCATTAAASSGVPRRAAPPSARYSSHAVTACTAACRERSPGSAHRAGRAPGRGWCAAASRDRRSPSSLRDVGGRHVEQHESGDIVAGRPVPPVSSRNRRRPAPPADQVRTRGPGPSRSIRRRSDPVPSSPKPTM